MTNSDWDGLPQGEGVTIDGSPLEPHRDPDEKAHEFMAELLERGRQLMAEHRALPDPGVVLRAPLIGRLLGHRYVQVIIDERWEVRRVYQLPRSGADVITSERTGRDGPWWLLSDFQHIWLTHSHTYR